MKKLKILTGTVAAIALSFIIFLVLPISASQADHVEVHGHRGARARRPENTLPAFKYAIEVGVDVLEMDMAVTKDRHIVISHDQYINPVICLGPHGERLAAEGD